MHIHILGICGTFMGSVAQLAKQLGHRVTGCDARVYPPMSDQLESAGIELIEGYDPQQLSPAPDLTLIGNALSRGNPCVEYLLDHRLSYMSGPQWLGQTLLVDRHVLAVSGTHGKTSTSSMLTAVLQGAGLQPGYLIGGVPLDGGISASLGGGEFFVVEADEYDSAFFDKRSKFVHYHSDTLLINNIEFDHADIFADLAAIQRQFHHLVRTVPGCGTIIYPSADEAIETVLAAGCWSDRVTFGDADADGDWQYRLLARDGSSFEVLRNCAGELIEYGRVSWRLTGHHNVSNAMGAIIAARGVGVILADSCGILSTFAGVKRRMEVLYENRDFTLYDDFAHHPTAIATTLEGLRDKVGDAAIVAVIEPRSATMRQGIHGDALAQSLAHADHVVWYRSVDMTWDIEAIMAGSAIAWEIVDNIDAMVQRCVDLADPGSHMVMMSNGGFDGLAQKLLFRLDR